MTEALQSERLVEVLLVEDNYNDFFFTQEGFKEAGVTAHLNHVENGRECMAFLRREGGYQLAARPDLILLDINMPYMDGRQVLEQVRNDELLKTLPVVVLTTSNRNTDISDMYRLYCNAYFVKPIDFDEFIATIRLLGEFWFHKAKLPPKLNS